MGLRASPCAAIQVAHSKGILGGAWPVIMGSGTTCVPTLELEISIGGREAHWTAREQHEGTCAMSLGRTWGYPLSHLSPLMLLGAQGKEF